MKNRLKATKYGFSLLEASILMLIIGIIIAGVISGSTLIKKSMLNTAKNLTQNAPVGVINGLVLWLEPTLEESFLSQETEDNSYVTTWHDLNPQSVIKNNATRLSGSDKITYVSEAINGLPALHFADSSEYASLSGDSFRVKPNQFTLFMVVKAENPLAHDTRTAFCDGGGNSGFCYITHNYPTVGSRLAYTYNDGYFLNISSTSQQSAEAEIIAIYCCNSTIKMRVNGTNHTIDSPTTGFTAPVGKFFIGNSHDSGQDEPWLGYIAEVIVYDHNLNNNEIASIEKYLSQKYKIRLN